jgi:hypothetical protein
MFGSNFFILSRANKNLSLSNHPLPPLFREWCCGAPVPSGGSAGASVGSLPGRRPIRGRGQPAVAAGRHSGRHGRRGGPHQRSQRLPLATSQQERGQGKLFFSSKLVSTILRLIIISLVFHLDWVGDHYRDHPQILVVSEIVSDLPEEASKKLK